MEKILKKIYREMVINNQPQELRLIQREYFNNFDMCNIFNELANKARRQEDYKQADKHELREQEYHRAYQQNIKDGAVSA